MKSKIKTQKKKNQHKAADEFCIKYFAYVFIMEHNRLGSCQFMWQKNCFHRQYLLWSRELMWTLQFCHWEWSRVFVMGGIQWDCFSVGNAFVCGTRKGRIHRLHCCPFHEHFHNLFGEVGNLTDQILGFCRGFQGKEKSSRRKFPLAGVIRL